MLKSFHIGGIHPPENKLSRSLAITNALLPTTVTIPLCQHIGAPATPCIEKGDHLKVGDRIGNAGGFVSANIHTSVSGTVTSLGTVLDGSGILRPAVTIAVEGDLWNESIDRSETLVTTCTLSPKEIIQKIAAAGIVGMGGATFPTQVKLSVPPGKKAEYLIINGVECEPYLTSDHRIMLEKGAELLVGISLLKRALEVKTAYIGIENNKLDAIANLKKLTTEIPEIKIVPLRVQYPQGGEKQLIDAIIGRQVPSGGLPIDVGVVVQNIGTAYAVYEAVQKNKPLFERIVTVTGKSLEHPANLRVRIGTPLTEVIAQCGGIPENTAKIINGGPMMGRAVCNLESCITKGTSGILLIPETEAPRPQETSCIKCGKCVTVCPMGLEPYLLNTLSKLGRFTEMEPEKVTDCIECGSCAYTCPANLPLLDYIRLGKSEVLKMIRARK